jgi:hypothetical protein
MLAESHAKMSEKPYGRLTATAIICRLSMSHHSGLLCGQPFRTKGALAKVVRMDSHRFRIEMDFILATDY